MEFKDFKEVNDKVYAQFSGERICFWDSGHKQHFFIKDYPKIIQDEYYRIKIYYDSIKFTSLFDESISLTFNKSLPLLTEAIKKWQEIQY